MRCLRAAGISTQITIAPMLPNHPQRFADLADEASDRVIVDTYFDGDGANGRRSRALRIGELYERLGYADWFKLGAELELLAGMRTRWATIVWSSAATASTPCNISAGEKGMQTN